MKVWQSWTKRRIIVILNLKELISKVSLNVFLFLFFFKDTHKSRFLWYQSLLFFTRFFRADKFDQGSKFLLYLFPAGTKGQGARSASKLGEWTIIASYYSKLEPIRVTQETLLAGRRVHEKKDIFSVCTTIFIHQSARQ